MNSSGRTEQAFQILTALADGPLHGYGIILEVENLSGGQARLRLGTLYGALDRLAGEGLIAPDREEVVNGRLRRYYRLTEAGSQVLAQEAERLAHESSVALARLAKRGVRGPAAAGT